MVKKLVIPAEAEIQVWFSWSWIPVFTGMTGKVNHQRALFQRAKVLQIE